MHQQSVKTRDRFEARTKATDFYPGLRDASNILLIIRKPGFPIAGRLLYHDFRDHPFLFRCPGWISTMRVRAWASFAEVRQTFNTEDFVAPYVVFDIGGNKYRLIAEINFGRKVLLIRGIMTHQEYAKGTWRT